MAPPLISVIVPVFDVEAYLSKCLDSIIHQSYTNLEIVLVDDGSTDSCPQKCDDYAKSDSRIRAIHKEHGGLSSARNAGLDVANGEFLAFADSDDWLELDMYEQMITVAIENQADLVTCDVNKWKYGRNIHHTISRNTGKRTIIEDNDELFYHILKPNPAIKFEVWNKLFRRSIIGDTRFKVGQCYEDVYFDRIVLMRVRKCVSIDKALYNYLVARPGSTIFSFDVSWLSKLYELDEYVSYFTDRGRQDIADIFLHCATTSSINLYCLAVKHGFGDDVKRMIHKRFYNYYKKDKKKGFRCTLFELAPNVYTYLGSIKRRGQIWFGNLTEKCYLLRGQIWKE